MNLTNNKIKNSYGGVLNIGATGFSGNQEFMVTDGFGNPTPWHLSETSVNVLGTFSVNGVVFDPESGYHGSFYSTATQSNAGTTTTNKVSYNGTFTNNNVIFQNNTEVKFLEKATYDIQFSLQFEKSGGGNSTVQIWFQKNGVNISDSNTEITIHSNNGKFVAAWDIMLNLNANDIIEICWHSNDISVKLVPHPAQTNPNRPAIPSVIFSALQVTNILTGAPGATGPMGAPGPTGPAGATGQSIIGATGAQGYQGFQGLKGDDGSNGAVGAQGFQGVQGFQGLKGDVGSNGAAGVQGRQGFQGVQGRQGFQGVQGRQGFQGFQGVDGVAGADAGLSLRYRIQSVSTFVVPNTGRVTTDNDIVSTITEILFNYEDFYTVDAKPYWNQLVTWLSIPTNKASLIITTIESPSTKGIFPITSINSNSTLQFFNIVLDAPIYSNGTLSVGQTLVSSWIGEAIGLPGPTGPDGLQGPIGIGVQGLQGPAGTGGGGTGSGTQGFQGFQGLAGSTGSNGTQGFQGFQGRQGVQGLVGSTGSNGTQGFQGLAGSTGSNGTQGFQGSQGFQGRQGVQGLAGSTGSNGNQGFQGFQGLAGSNGSNGNQGFQGVQGRQGFQGLAGLTGTNGTQGFQGIKGDIGSTGPAGGPQGPQGFQGQEPSASLITLTDAATISWTYSTGQTAKVNINGNRALTITGATNGDYGTLILTHGITNSIITSFPTTSEFVDGTYSFSANAGTIDIFSFVFDSGIYYWVYNKNFV